MLFLYSTLSLAGASNLFRLKATEREYSGGGGAHCKLEFDADGGGHSISIFQTTLFKNFMNHYAIKF